MSKAPARMQPRVPAHLQAGQRRRQLAALRLQALQGAAAGLLPQLGPARVTTQRHFGEARRLLPAVGSCSACHGSTSSGGAGPQKHLANTAQRQPSAAKRSPAQRT